jgi:hypothetical protein
VGALKKRKNQTNRSKVRVKQITQILVHTSSHADELLSLILLRHFGEEMFPGVTTATVTEFSGGILKEGDLPENIIGLGTGKGMFDEHGKKDGNICAATLVADKLGISGNPGLMKILAQTLQEDRNGSNVKNEIPSIVKILHMAKFSLEDVLGWYETVFWAEYTHEEKQPGVATGPTTLESGYELIKAYATEEKANEWKALADLAIEKRQEMFVKAKKHFQHYGKRQTLNTEDFGPLQIGFVELNKEQGEEFGAVMNSAARFCKIELFVQKSSDGNIQVFTDTRLKIDLTGLTEGIRKAEAKKRGVVIKDTASLAMEGTHPELLMWHLLEGAHSMLFNGSLSATMIEPTVLTPGELLEIIKETFARKEKGFQVDPMAFQPSRATRQLEGAFAK